MSETTKKSFKKGEILIRAGDPGNFAYIVEKGHVEILVRQAGQMIQIGTRGRGSILGEMAMIDDQPRTATVRALEDCIVMEISRADFARRVNSADPVINMVMHVIMTRYRDLMAKTEFAKLKPPEGDHHIAEMLENSHQIHDEALNTLKVHHDLRDAVTEKKLILHYQPIISLKNGMIRGFEALMRWPHPENGMISPGIFIPIAEETGMINEMSQWALETACDTVKEFQKIVPDTFVSVNFSVRDFSTGTFFEQVSATLDKKNVRPQSIHLEITESLLMQEPNIAKAALEQCRKKGISVSIDDFGSGYSSLSYLHNFPINILKIDQGFIRAMTTHDSSLVLVKSIIGLAQNMKMHVIAEGIESEREASLLRDLGCDDCQGFWFSKPVPREAALQLLQEWTPRQISTIKPS